MAPTYETNDVYLRPTTVVRNDGVKFIQLHMIHFGLELHKIFFFLLLIFSGIFIYFFTFLHFNNFIYITQEKKIPNNKLFYFHLS